MAKGRLLSIRHHAIPRASLFVYFSGGLLSGVSTPLIDIIYGQLAGDFDDYTGSFSPV
ncbi:hypothetical protein Hte_004543 [Hypoxylon texense]